MSVSGFYEGFNIAPYSNPMSIRPKKRALAFQQQVQVMIQERKNTRARFGDDSYKYQWDSVAYLMDDADIKSETDIWIDCNDSKDDSWLTGIISQRHAMRRQLMHRYEAEQNQKEEYARYMANKRTEDFERAMAISEKQQEERDEIEAERRKRIDAANAELQADRYIYLKKQKAQQKYEKGVKEGLAQQKKNQSRSKV